MFLIESYHNQCIRYESCYMQQILSSRGHHDKGLTNKKCSSWTIHRSQWEVAIQFCAIHGTLL